MALTKATYSMISGAPINVFDYMTEAQIVDVRNRVASIDVSGAIQAAIDANHGREIFLPSGTYRCESPIVMGGNGFQYDIIRGEGFPAYRQGTLINFINCNGFELVAAQQSISNLYIYGQKSGGTVDPDTLTFGNVGIYISGPGAINGSGAGIMNVTIENFDTGVATKNTTTSGWAGAYFIITNLKILYCVVGAAFCQTTTQVDWNGGQITSCTKHGLYTGPYAYAYQSVVLVNVLMEVCGTDVGGAPGNSIANAGICIRGICKFGMYGGYMEEVRNVFVDQYCSASFKKTWIQNVTNFYGQGEIDPGDSMGVEGLIISDNYDVTTFTNSLVTVTSTNSAANPRCYRIQSTSASGTPQIYNDYLIPNKGSVNYDAISIQNIDKSVLFWVKVQFQVKYVTYAPSQMGTGGTNPLTPDIRAFSYTSNESQPNNNICDLAAYNCSDGKWHQITQIKQIRAGSSYVNDTVNYIRWTLALGNNDYSGTALDMYIKAPVVTMFTQNGQQA